MPPSPLSWAARKTIAAAEAGARVTSGGAAREPGRILNCARPPHALAHGPKLNKHGQRLNRVNRANGGAFAGLGRRVLFYMQVD